jgi:hypothetical protein
LLHLRDFTYVSPDLFWTNPLFPLQPVTFARKQTSRKSSIIEPCG